jgi:hypothetical protein
VLEKVEVYISYGQGVQNKVEKIFLANSEKKLYYSDVVDLKKDICILYDVEPAEYLFGFDLGSQLFLAQHIYSIKLDPVTYVIYSDISYENNIQVRENHNLKIYLYITNEEEDSGIGLVKTKDLQNVRYDSLYFEYFIPGDNETVTQANQDTLAKTGTVDRNAAAAAERQETLLAGSNIRTFQYADVMKEFYEDYSGLFGSEGCSYCKADGNSSYVLNLSDKDIKYNSTCDKLKIKNVTINFLKRDDKDTSKIPDLEFGRQGIKITAYKYSPCEVKTRECAKQGNDCNCKFDSNFVITIQHQVSIRDEDDIRKRLGELFKIPCIVNNKAVSNKTYKTTLENARHFRQAMLDHEKMHCVQYRLLTEALFKGQFETGKPKPFYFGEKKESDVLFWGGEKTLADMICESVGDIPCCNPATKDCDSKICEGKETEILAKLATMMESLIQKRFKSFEGTDLVELPMWHFTFIQFNKYEWGDQSCGK